MDEMHFISDGMEISIKDMVRLGNKKEDILKLGYDTGNKKTFKLNGYDYKVILPHGNKKVVRNNPSIPNKKPQPNNHKKVSVKQTGFSNQILNITNTVKRKYKTNQVATIFLDDKEITVEDLAILFNCSYVTIKQALYTKVSLNINGYRIKVKIPEYRYLIKKDGIEFDNLTINEVVEKTGQTKTIIENMLAKGFYSKDEGWQILDKKVVLI